MTNTSVDDVVLRLAMSAYLGRYTGTSRVHSESGLRIPRLVCRAGPSAAHRRPAAGGALRVVDAGGPPVQTFDRVSPMAVVTGFYRTCVIDAVLDHSPAEYVRRLRFP